MALLIGGTLAYFFLPFPWWLVAVVLLAGVEVFEFRIWRWAVRERAHAGIEGMVGERGVLAAPGRVRIRGTSYPARHQHGEPGDPVIVESIDGMTLVVRLAGQGDLPG
jgi:membrane protein implicated in regulation of membrane protease activity